MSLVTTRSLLYTIAFNKHFNWLKENHSVILYTTYSHMYALKIGWEECNPLRITPKYTSKIENTCHYCACYITQSPHYMFYTLSLNKVARITSMTTCVSLCTPPFYKHLLLMPGRYRMCIRWKTLPLWVNGNLCSNFFKTVQHTQHTSLNILQECKVRLENCLQRQLSLHFTVCLVTSTSTDTKRTIMWSYILPNHTRNLESFGKISWFTSVFHHKLISKADDLPALVWYNTTHFLHITVHILQ
jgi:hypothetical protein